MRHTILTLTFAAAMMTTPAFGQTVQKQPHADNTQIMKPKSAEPQMLTLEVDDPKVLKAAKTKATMTQAVEQRKPQPSAVTTAKADGKTDETAPAADPANSPAPINGHIIHQSDGGKMCIGGVLCSKFCEADTADCKPTESLTIKLEKPAQISTIQLSAHDNIGKTKRSRLVVKVNGKAIADTLVYKTGSTLSIDVGQTGELITIESAHQYNGFLLGGEEAVIWDVYVFGNDKS